MNDLCKVCAHHKVCKYVRRVDDIMASLAGLVQPEWDVPVKVSVKSFECDEYLGAELLNLAKPDMSKVVIPEPKVLK